MAGGLYCQPPVLDWSQASGPRAASFGDIYFSAEDGLQESRAVFLKGCDLPQAWQGKCGHVVGELGFGTGLNALALWDLWRSQGPAKGWLHLVTIEKHPLSRTDAARALAAWPELQHLSSQLLAQWPSGLKGAHRLMFPSDRFSITLFQDEAEAALGQIEAGIDSWFLDGFAPDRNQAMWSQAVLDQVGRLSLPGARLATFTVAGAVRRGLQQAGFTVEKQPGFGRKRERLQAIYTGAAKPALSSPVARSPARAGRVAIIGAGIAGVCLARALRLRGREVVLIDAAGAAAGASGAPAGLLTPRLERSDRPHVRATLAAFEFARNLYQDREGFQASGVVRLPKTPEERARLHELAGLMDEGFRWQDEALIQDRAGRIEPRRLVLDLLDDMPVVPGHVSRVNEAPDGVVLLDPAGEMIAEADIAVHASGHSAALALEAIRPSAGWLAVIAGAAPDRPVVWGGYACAAPGGGILLGATHRANDEPGSCQAAIAEFRAELQAYRPALAAGLGEAVLQTWSGVRAVTPDQFAVCGPLPEPGYDERWRYLASGRLPRIHPEPGQPGRQYILSGFGSRGFAHAPLLAEALASDLCGEPSPLERAGREIFHPARFAWRQLRRQA